MNNGTIWSFERSITDPFEERRTIVAYILELRSLNDELWVRYAYSPPTKHDLPDKGFTSSFKDFSAIFNQNLNLSFV